MSSMAKMIRLLQINWIFIRFGLDEIMMVFPLFRPIRVWFYLLPWNWFSRRNNSTPLTVRIRLALEHLGPVFIKFGQTLSTRRDLLPSGVADELEKLQDQVPPFSGHHAQAVVEKALHKPIDQLFRRFDIQPLASASVAQVHAAALLDGREVVVKVLRSGIAKKIQRDVDVLAWLADMAQRWWSEGPRLRPRELVEQYRITINNELNLMREAANASQLRRNFAHSEMLYVPEVYWPYCCENVMVIERIYGVPVNDLPRLKEAGVNLKRLSENGVEIFFTQVFKHNFFHADMHPGNIFVSIEDREHPRYIGVDFGIVGSLAEKDQYYLAANFLAFFHNDYRRVARLHVDSAWVPADVRVDEFEGAIRAVCEPIFQRPLNEISFANLLLRLFQIARQFRMEVQPQLFLLQKTLFNIEGLGRQLYPELDLWKTAKPFLEHWMRRQTSWPAIVRRAGKSMPSALEQLPRIPQQLNGMFDEIKQLDTKARERGFLLRQEIRQAQRNIILAILIAALTIAVAIAYTIDF